MTNSFENEMLVASTGKEIKMALMRELEKTITETPGVNYEQEIQFLANSMVAEHNNRVEQARQAKLQAERKQREQEAQAARAKAVAEQQARLEKSREIFGKVLEQVSAEKADRAQAEQEFQRRQAAQFAHARAVEVEKQRILQEQAEARVKARLAA